MCQMRNDDVGFVARDMIDYLPSYMQDYKEIKAIMDTEDVQLSKIWEDTEDVLNDQFVKDATENGVRRWEKILGITPKGDFSMDERKFNILARLNEQLPYTMEVLKSMLTSLCGWNGYTLRLDHQDYLLLVKLSLSNKSNIDAVKEMLDRIVPANILINVDVFNTHGMLKPYTHEYLSKYTYTGVREENI